MKKKTTLIELEPKKLTKILNIFSDAQAEDKDIPKDQQKSELLQDRLSETLLCGSLKNSSLRKELVHLCNIAGIASTEPIRNLLTGPNTDLELIKKVKQHGKKLSRTTSSEIGHETANVIYYAAIASALVYHNKKISRFSHTNLEEAFTVFVETEWISNDLKELFEKAGNYCQKREKK